MRRRKTINKFVDQRAKQSKKLREVHNLQYKPPLYAKKMIRKQDKRVKKLQKAIKQAAKEFLNYTLDSKLILETQNSPLEKVLPKFKLTLD